MSVQGDDKTNMKKIEEVKEHETEEHNNKFFCNKHKQKTIIFETCFTFTKGRIKECA